MRPRPGSFAWLVSHDLRLNWRQFTGVFAKSNLWLSIALGSVGLIALHGLATIAVDWLAPHMTVGGTQRASGSPIEIALVCIMAWMTSQGLLGTSRMLYDRGDLDLLIGSPLPASRVFGARVLSLAASSLGSTAILVLPVANAGAILDGPHWLAIYPTLAALALMGTALGAATAMWLYILFGPRRARLVSQVTAAFVAGAFVLSIQIAALLPEAARNWLWTAAEAAHVADLLAVPTAAVRGQWPALLVCGAIGVALFATVVIVLAKAFAHASASAVAEDGTGRRAGASDTRAVRFRPGLAASLRRKEWRLLMRDPNLFAQLSLQIIYTLPIAVVLLRSDQGFPAAIGLAPVIVVVAVQVASSLSWIAVSAEDAPELIAAAPVAQADVEQAKLSAIAVPVLLIVAGPLIGLAFYSWKAAIVTALFAVMAASTGALLNLWHPMPGKRRGMLRRHSQSKIVAMIEHLLALIWAVAVVLGLIGSVLVAIPICLSFALLLACRSGWVPAVPARSLQPA